MANERRSENVTVIMPGDALPADLIENADDPEKMSLDTSRTKKYVKSLLERPTAEVWKEINDQMTVLILLLRDASLKWLEVWTNHSDHKMREEAKQHYVALSRESAAIVEHRQALAKAIGLNITGEIGETEASSLPSLYDPKPMSKEEFEKTFMPLTPKPVLADMRTITIEKK